MTESNKDRRRFFLDCEFIEDGHTIVLLSLGCVCEDGREFYAENADADWTLASEWVRNNVLPQLHHYPLIDPLQIDVTNPEVLPHIQIAENFLEFVGIPTQYNDIPKPEFWAYYGSYDWVAVAQLYGRMIDLPGGWPMFPMDVKQLAEHLGNPKLPAQAAVEHHALADARWTRDAHDFLVKYSTVKSRWQV